MRKLLFSLLQIGMFGILPAQTFTEWQDPQTNAVNRLPMRAAYFAYESTEKAAIADKTSSTRFLSLDGTWRFNWARHADMRPTGFFRTDYDDKAWSSMPVPGMWELNGYGDPLYVTEGYAWSNQAPKEPPVVPVEENHVGSYRRWIELPDTWSGQQIIAHIGSATSNLYLWVNGRFAGYSEDSKLPAEFDITRFLKPGRNLLAMQVFRWSDGSYLEDQDFFRLSGIARESYLYARDKRHIANVRLDAKLSENYTRGTLDVELEFSAAAKGCTAEAALSAPDGKILAVRTVKISGTTTRLTLDAGRVQPWSAEMPALYSVTVLLKNTAGETLEAIPLNTGFREIGIEDGQFRINGQPVLIKGANRHEMDPDGGYVVSRERMLEDIRIFKENNFNAVRTSHYPDDPYWYELCDRYGLYVVSEANLESHGMGYGDATLARNASYAKAHLERNERHVKHLLNHPSIVIWSLGNEAGSGPNFDACYDWIKAYDPSRPIQYEQAIHTPGRRNTEIVCPMYWSYEECEAYLRDDPQKPLIQCEYAHAMGNSMGGFGRYWQMIRREPRFQGGFIWDFADQSLRKTGKNGVQIWGYGGDWNHYDASGKNFCNNGLFAPDRTPNPHLYEVRYWQQPVWSRLGEDGQTLSVFNERFFRPLDNCYLRWTVLRNGDPVRSGIVTDLRIAPQQTATVVLPLDATSLPDDGELLLNVEYRLTDAEPLLKPDHLVAYQQFTLRQAAAEPAVAYAGESITIRDNDRNYLIAETPAVRVDFERTSGYLVRYEVGGRSLLANGSALRPDFWRAPTDNDYGAELQKKNRIWADPGLRLTALEHTTDAGTAVITAHYDLTATGGQLTLVYRIRGDGRLTVNQRLTAAQRTDVPDLMRFGLRMEMPAGYDRIDYYGRGPWENYTDRKDGALIGRYRQTVDEQFYPYNRPQETGTKSDIRRWRQTGADGCGAEFTAPAPFCVSALHYTQESLDEGLEKRQMHAPEVASVEEICLSIHGAHYGLGCIHSWGQLPEPEHRMPYGNYDFEFTISPIIR